jgi:hypothetical protein
VSGWWQSPIVVLAVLTWLGSPPKSIGEAAAREAVRRQLVPKSSALLTNAGQPVEIPLVAPPPAEPPAGTDPAVVQPPAGIVPPAAAEPPTGVVKDETWWRTRVSAANQTLKRDIDTADALNDRINLLQRDVVNVDDPIRQQALREELRKTTEEIERTKLLIEADRKAIEDLQEEARRQNVPPGWIR